MPVTWKPKDGSFSMLFGTTHAIHQESHDQYSLRLGGKTESLFVLGANSSTHQNSAAHVYEPRCDEEFTKGGLKAE